MGDNIVDEYMTEAKKEEAKKSPTYSPMSAKYGHVNPNDTETLEKLGLVGIPLDEFLNNK